MSFGLRVLVLIVVDLGKAKGEENSGDCVEIQFTCVGFKVKV